MLPPRWKRQLAFVWRCIRGLALANKFKILIGFYQIATRLESVYDAVLPDQVRSLLVTIQLAISLGIDGIPFACVGAQGYTARLIFWTLTPIVTVGATVCLGAVRVEYQAYRKDKQLASRAAVFNATAPIALRVFFLCYPSNIHIALITHTMAPTFRAVVAQRHRRLLEALEFQSGAARRPFS